MTALRTLARNSSDAAAVTCAVAGPSLGTATKRG